MDTFSTISYDILILNTLSLVEYFIFSFEPIPDELFNPTIARPLVPQTALGLTHRLIDENDIRPAKHQNELQKEEDALHDAAHCAGEDHCC
jgi:hypothetical protein